MKKGEGMPNQELVHNLLAEYVDQREKGTEPKQALHLLARIQPDLPIEERQQLFQMIRAWEQRNQEPAPPQPSQDEVQTCPLCGKDNPASEKYCYSCGQLLGVSLSTRILESEEPDHATFGAMSKLLIMVRGHAQKPINVSIGDVPVLIGRSVPGSATQPDIDLTPYNAESLGVSRIHAAIQRASQTLTIVDKGSSNHTYINGEKVHPHEVRVIHDGDEIRFARLTTIFIFKREVRRL
ncbi:MAG: FHA domain-containing protein [Anaerolineae bacterium]|nr:MAG: FHA domain-containing protein [Anaerolineae bacterium]